MKETEANFEIKTENLDNRFDRNILILGAENQEKIKNTSVLLCGVGGVGGGALEALARVGVGNITIVDFDTISYSNLNRQIIALSSNVGNSKVKEWEKRVKLINPECNINAIETKISLDNVAELANGVDYIIDAIDDVKGKIGLIKYAKENNIKIISSMGTGNKIHPEMLEIKDISKTEVCPLARVMRKKLKEIGITNGVKVLFTREIPLENNSGTVGSISFVPPVAGMLIAGEIVRDILEIE